MSEVEKWRDYWRNQATPLHRCDSDAFYRRHAAELKDLFASAEPRSVLELGCGDGALYEHLGFDRCRYKGVDLSPRLLARFAQRHPGVELECGDASAYRDGRCYDLIFSNGMIQHFDFKMLRRLFANATAMMGAESLFVCAGICWKDQRSRFWNGLLLPPYRASSLLALKSRAARLLRRDRMGYWHHFAHFQSLAAEQEMSVEFFGSMCYFYRFHAVMRKGVHHGGTEERHDGVGDGASKAGPAFSPRPPVS